MEARILNTENRGIFNIDTVNMLETDNKLLNLNPPSSSRLLLEHHGSHRIVELLGHNSNTPTANASTSDRRGRR